MKITDPDMGPGELLTKVLLNDEVKNMIRGTTPTVFIPIVGLDISTLDTIYLTFKQNKKILTKRESEVEKDVENQRLIVKFTQEETLQFNDGHIDVQLRGSAEGQKIASNITRTTMKAILLEGVIE